MKKIEGDVLMKQKLITAILTAIAILSPLLIVPNFLNSNYNILKLWTLLIGGFFINHSFIMPI